MDLYLHPGTHDLDTTGFRIRLTSGIETPRQRLEISLQTFLGEWFLDQGIGFPYYRDVLVKNPNLDLIKSLFRRKILADPDVISVDRLDMSLDPTRLLLVTFDATLSDQSVITVSLPSAEPVIAAEDLFIDQAGNTIIEDDTGDTVING